MNRNLNVESAPWPIVGWYPDVVIRRADGSIEPAVTLSRTRNGYVRLQLRSGETIKTSPAAIVASDRGARFADALRIAERHGAPVWGPEEIRTGRVVPRTWHGSAHLTGSIV